MGSAEWRELDWAEAGGTAVLFLPALMGARQVCRLGDDFPLPRRVADPSAAPSYLVQADFAPQPRRIRGASSLTFVDQDEDDGGNADTGAEDTGAEDTGEPDAGEHEGAEQQAPEWRVSATIDGRPFVLERPVGRGRIVVVADASFLQNIVLEHADAAPLAVDFVHAFGVPVFDERAFFPRVSRSALGYLAASPAIAVLGGMALVAIVFAWQGLLVPARTLAAADAGAPNLDTFVDSLAILYAGTRDYARVLERYRHLTAARLRRHFGLTHDTPLTVLDQRLRRDRRLARGALDLLARGATVSDDGGLRAAVRSLDQLVHEATA